MNQAQDQEQELTRKRRDLLIREIISMGTDIWHWSGISTNELEMILLPLRKAEDDIIRRRKNG